MAAITTILIIVIAIYLLGNLAFSMMFDIKAPRPDINKKGAKEGAQMRDGFPEDWAEQNAQLLRDIFIESHDGLRLHAFFAENSASRNCVILLHGYTSNALKCAAYAEHYYELGYSVLLPDARAHGQSQGRFIGMDQANAMDVVSWCEYLAQQDSSRKILLHGISMGAGATLTSLGEKLPEQVAAAVADSGYPSAAEVMGHQLKSSFHLPARPLLFLADIVCRMKCGYSLLHQKNALDAVSRSQTPTFFIHGNKDNFVPIAQHEKLYAACRSEKERLLLDEPHVMGRFHCEELYWQKIDTFVKSHIA